MESCLLLWLLRLLLLLLVAARSVEGLMCHYCYQADVRADCHLNVLECEAGHVCSVETSNVTYTHRWKGRVHKTTMYRMGCEHYSMCRDRVVSGPGPYGYSVTTKICCCNHLCEKPDGVGQNRLENCPSLWSNYTSANNTPGVHGLPAKVIALFLLWMLQY